ncbi:MAG: bifunctional 5,10-methylenetetrahydrofolate dehydrogenase/5,10-methenyltetrahydrofolate cyclohydrolase [Candidatus Uhrbacteria bacterium]
MRLLDGKTLAKKIRATVKNEVASLATKPGLAVILVGSDPASHLYVSLKEKACLTAGINFTKYLFLAQTTEAELLQKINELNQDQKINGILVQLPLPNQNADKIIAAINPNKDVDGFHPENLRRLEANETCLVSPVVLGVMELLKKTGESLNNKKAVLVMSQIFARPFTAVFNQQKIQTEIVSADDPNIFAKTKNSDILITAVGRPNLIVSQGLKNGAIVIDIGTTHLNGKVVGDVDISSIESTDGWLTPVPGGVGPMTVALLLRNVLAASKQHNLPPTAPKN